jgi:hypothetical protein
MTMNKLVEVLPTNKKRPGPPPKTLNVKRIAALRAQGIGWKRIAKRLRVAPATIFRQGVNRQFEPMPAGRPKKILDHRKLDSIVEVLPASPVEMLETFLIFDARALDMETRQELLRILPQLVHIRRAWKAEYMECGCISCHKKRPDYASGGFCVACQGRILQRMRNRYRNVIKGRDLAQELATFKDALQLKYNAAQRLFNGDD